MPFGSNMHQLILSNSRHSKHSPLSTILAMITASSTRSRRLATSGECVALSVRIRLADFAFQPRLHVRSTDVNTESKRLKEAIITVSIEYFSICTRVHLHRPQCIKAGQPVFFGCDVGKFLDSPHGIMDLDVYDFEVCPYSPKLLILRYLCVLRRTLLVSNMA